MAILSYVGRVHIAVRIVEGLYPGATLHEVNGSAPDGAPTTDPKAITMLRYATFPFTYASIPNGARLQLHLPQRWRIKHFHKVGQEVGCLGRAYSRDAPLD